MTQAEYNRQAVEYEIKVRNRVTSAHSWYDGWTNWHEQPPPANVAVEYMYLDGRRYGIKRFEDPAHTWYRPVAAWWWRVPPTDLYYDPLRMPLEHFKLVRADLGPHEATRVWEEANTRKYDTSRPLPANSALARIQRGELRPEEI